MQKLNTSLAALFVLGLAACGGQQATDAATTVAEQPEVTEAVEESDALETAEEVVEEAEETMEQAEDMAEALTGEALYMANCNGCHWIEAPAPDDVRRAPPIHGVMRHVRDGFDAETEADYRQVVTQFIVDYSLEPSAETALCSGHAIERFGMMPSMAERVTPEELQLIAEYLFDDVEPMEPHDPPAEGETEEH